MARKRPTIVPLGKFPNEASLPLSFIKCWWQRHFNVLGTGFSCKSIVFILFFLLNGKSKYITSKKKNLAALGFFEVHSKNSDVTINFFFLKKKSLHPPFSKNNYKKNPTLQFRNGNSVHHTEPRRNRYEHHHQNSLQTRKRSCEMTLAEITSQ